MIRPRAAVTVLAGYVLAGGLVGGCGHRQERRLTKASRELARAVRGGGVAAVRARLVPGSRAAANVESMLAGTAKKSWSHALRKPQEVLPRALVFVEPARPVTVLWTEGGWRFAEDPTDLYAQDTPRRALEALVRASQGQRWDVLLRLAPQRYRTGLSVEDLRAAWTDGEHAAVLHRATQRLSAALAGPIVADGHEAALDVGDGHMARLEREGDRWVVVDF